MSTDDDHKPGENCAKDLSKTIWYVRARAGAHPFSLLASSRRAGPVRGARGADAPACVFRACDGRGARRECFGGLKKVTEDFYAWWDKTRGENAAIGILVAILVILACIFILLPAAFALLICAGVLAIAAVIIDAVYKDKDAAPSEPAKTEEAKEAPAEEKV